MPPLLNDFFNNQRIIQGYICECQFSIVATLTEDDSSLCESSEIVRRTLCFDRDPSFCSPLKMENGNRAPFSFNDNSISL